MSRITASVRTVIGEKIIILSTYITLKDRDARSIGLKLVLSLSVIDNDYLQGEYRFVYLSDVTVFGGKFHF